MNEKQLFLDVIGNCNLGVISTVNAEGKPQSAVIGIGYTPEFEIVFGTFNTTRKYKNIQTNPDVALVIGWDDGRTVQYAGVAKELDPNEIQLVRDYLWTNNPGTKKYYTDERQRYFIIKPTWMRYTDMTTEPRHIIEHTF
jgi:uncharacterized pyridoxamine 5'-phosphate oxidase family protein